MSKISRRDFLQRSAMAAAAFTIAPNIILGKSHGHVSPIDKFHTSALVIFCLFPSPPPPFLFSLLLFLFSLRIRALCARRPIALPLSYLHRLRGIADISISLIRAA